jgi:hypothetical protein
VRACCPKRSPIKTSVMSPTNQNVEIDTALGFLKNQNMRVSRIKSGVKSVLKILI